MKITDIRDECYRMLEINAGVTVSDSVKADCANALNRALQVMNLAGKDYFLMETLTQALTIGVSEYVMAAAIQRVIGPVRLQGGSHLRELRSRGQYDGFGLYFQGASSMAVTSGTPVAYFLESSRSTSGADSVTLTLCIAPAPVASGTVEFDAIKEPAAYTAANMSDTNTTVPVAHQYVETLLVPLVRYFLSRSRYFTNAGKLPLIEADYQAAMSAMGLADPVQNTTRKTNPDLEEAA
ncbi:MAG: hypothetical protein WCK57_00660 [Verrucomicrobiae bacterium]